MCAVLIYKTLRYEFIKDSHLEWTDLSLNLNCFIGELKTFYFCGAPYMIRRSRDGCHNTSICRNTQLSECSGDDISFYEKWCLICFDVAKVFCSAWFQASKGAGNTQRKDCISGRLDFANLHQSFRGRCIPKDSQWSSPIGRPVNQITTMATKIVSVFG